MDIKEIALKVAGEIYDVNFDEHKPSGKRLISFAEALIAELAKGNEHIGAIQNGKFQWNTDGGPEKWRARKDFSGKLYAIPPTAEQIANETAEAIAKFVAFQRNDIPATGIEFAEVIRSGEWRKFVKEV